MALAEQCVAGGNINAISDAAVAFTLGMAALKGSGCNVHINIKSLKDEAAGIPFQERLASLEANAAKIAVSIRKHMEERGVIIPL